MKSLHYIITFYLVTSIFDFASGLAQSKSTDQFIVITQIRNLKDQLLKDISQEQLIIAVLPFETTAGRSEARGLGEAASILLNEVLLKENRVTVIERSRLKDILDEIGFSQTGLTRSEIKIGQLLNTDYLVAGAVADLNSRFLVAARLIEVKSGTVVSSSSIELPAVNFMSVSQNLVQIKRYPITAAFHSMVLPGWGQFYNEKPQKGTIILGTQIVLAAGAVSGYLLHKQAKDAYDRANQREIAQEKYDEMDKYSKVNWGCLGLMGVVWLYGVVDAYFDAREQIKEFQSNTAGFSFDYQPLLNQDKIELAVQIRF